MLSCYRPRVRSIVEVEARGEIPPRRRREQRGLDVTSRVVRLGVLTAVLRPHLQVAGAEDERRVLRAQQPTRESLRQRDARREFPESPELTVLVIAQIARELAAVDHRSVVGRHAARLVPELRLGIGLCLAGRGLRAEEVVLVEDRAAALVVEGGGDAQMAPE